ncbi:MAG: riboflavin synthase [Thermodesulfobacteriota bacterium]|nr:riboflavin synthase [Thermodesulfobacteriota bacterium]
MFTGIIEGLGSVKSAIDTGGGMRMHIQGDFPLEGIRVGDSIAVNGACLTAVEIGKSAFSVDVAPETLSRTTLGHMKVGDRVNLERALCLGDRLSGHLVTGHIDGIGTVKSRRPLANAILFAFTVPEALSRYIVEKGSVAIDGISLTVNACDHRGFEVSVIPHTASITTMGLRRPGDSVNIETDLVGKYVERFTRHFVAKSANRKDAVGSVDETLLKETGFM